MQICFHLLTSFQFLLGRLETAFSLEDVRDAIAFQFLLGRLETLVHVLRDVEVPTVSIPLR